MVYVCSGGVLGRDMQGLDIKLGGLGSASFSATRSLLRRAWQRRLLSTRVERRNCGATLADGDGPGFDADVI